MNSSDTPPSRVIFFQVREIAAKLSKIAETARTHFQKKEPFLIVVEDLRAQEFVDELLWKFPSISFLPHSATDEPTTDWIAITKIKKNVNGAKIAFNLCSTPLLIEGPFRIIYELEDLTAPVKKNLSSMRFDAYKQLGWLIEAS
ncbi:MAG: DNA polymerase III subunit chi [Chlamydiota bacterium]